MKAITIAACAIVASAPFAFGQTAMVVIANPDAVKWQPAPEAFPKGAEIAFVSGDMKTGPWVVRLKLPAGYAIPPHTHKNIENVTVISGEMRVGMGSTLDKSNATTVAPGGYYMMPVGMQHYAFTETGAITQNSSDTGSSIDYVNPADDPRKK